MKMVTRIPGAGTRGSNLGHHSQRTVAVCFGLFHDFLKVQGFTFVTKSISKQSSTHQSLGQRIEKTSNRQNEKPEKEV
jgi:hypothetical protein